MHVLIYFLINFYISLCKWLYIKFLFVFLEVVCILFLSQPQKWGKNTQNSIWIFSFFTLCWYVGTHIAKYKNQFSNTFLTTDFPRLRRFLVARFHFTWFLRLHKKIYITRFYSIKCQYYGNFFDIFSAILWLS